MGNFWLGWSWWKNLAMPLGAARGTADFSKNSHPWWCDELCFLTVTSRSIERCLPMLSTSWVWKFSVARCLPLHMQWPSSMRTRSARHWNFRSLEYFHGCKVWNSSTDFHGVTWGSVMGLDRGHHDDCCPCNSLRLQISLPGAALMPP